LGSHLQLLLPLQGKLLEGLDNQASVGAVIDEDGWAAHPGLQIIYGQRNILSVVLQNKQRVLSYISVCLKSTLKEGQHGTLSL
jgi:hypothetical protein